MTEKKLKHNHAANLNLILNKLIKSTPTGVTLEELADLCKVSKRNIYRYLNELEEMGIEINRPIKQKPGTPGKGKYHLKQKNCLDSLSEANLLMLIAINAKKEAQYRQLLINIYEFFIKYLAAKYKIPLPFDWKLEACINKSKQQNLQMHHYMQEGNETLYYLSPSKNQDQQEQIKENVKLILSPTAAKDYHNITTPFKVVSKKLLEDGSLLVELLISNDNILLFWLFQLGGEVEIIQPTRIRKKLTEYCNKILKVHKNKQLSSRASS